MSTRSCYRLSHFAYRVTSIVLLTAVIFLMTAGSSDAARSSRRARYQIKIATLATDGSTWMNLMYELDDRIREETAGDVGLRFYPGGVQGDEMIVLDKIRFGQLQGGGLTGVGLGQVAPSLRIMEVPFLLRDSSEVDAVHRAMDPIFEAELEQAGFVLLGWAEVGFVYLYSRQPVASLDDLRRQKVWVWEGDPLAEALFREADISPVPLAISDVLTSLQTGLITAVYVTPLANIAMQWFTRIAYTTDLPLTYSMGAVVISRDSWEKIPAQHRPVVRRLCDEYFGKLSEATRRDNAESMKVMAENGIRTVVPPDPEIAAFREIGERVRLRLVGSLYNQSILDKVLQALEDHRSAQGSPDPASGAAHDEETPADAG